MRYVLTLLIVGLLMIPTSAFASDWVVSASEAAKHVQDGATILDTRGKVAFAWKHVEGAQRVTWDDFTLSGSRRGVLLADAVLERKLRALGVSNKRSVIVVGDPDAWGEDGRIVWMLRTLGHSSASLVDGGFSALKAKKVATSRGSDPAKKGDFVVKRTGAYSATKADVRAALGSSTVMLDTRENREFEGSTPYGESRGGHLPGAKHLYFKSLLTGDGRLIPASVITKRLSKLGIKKDTPVIAYCTGGVRSGWMVAVLQDLGYKHAKNYAGSMWEWAAAENATHPLESK